MELNPKNVLDPWKIEIQEITTFGVPWKIEIQEITPFGVPWKIEIQEITPFGVPWKIEIQEITTFGVPWKIEIQEITTFGVPLSFKNTLFPYIVSNEVQYEVEYGMKIPKALTVLKLSPEVLFNKKDG